MAEAGKERKDPRASQICSICRQRFYTATNPTAKLLCPSCDKISKNRLCETPSSGEPHKSYHLKKFARKFKIRNEGHDQGRAAKHAEHLLDSSDSSIELRTKKRALLIGVTYMKLKCKLKGTVNDVKKMRDFLIHSFDFKPQNIRVLTEEKTDAELTPTKKNIQESLEWLVEGCQPGDSLVFYFSGHGLRQPDFNGDELDGFDETICPVDFLEEGMILDNDINSTIVRPLREGVTLHAIVDACHSGTILDLLFVYNRETNKWEDNKPPSGAEKDTKGGLAISISACEDCQQAADTSVFTGEETSGAMTYTLIDTAKRFPELTYGDLISKMYEAIDKVNKRGGLPVRILKRVLHKKLLQKPQLSASKPFDVYEKQFLL